MKNKSNPSISPELEAFMQLNKLPTVAALLSLMDEELIELPGFGWHLLKEILLLREIQ